MSLYVSQQKSELLDSLETQVRFSQLVAILVGAKGLGKSFLLERLHGRLKDEVAIANIDASMAMSDDQLDKTISLQLGLSWQESNSDLANRISNTHSENVLITIDNAHLLSGSCLEFILKLNQTQLANKQSSVFILLAGETSLPLLINKTPTFTQHPEMCVVFELEPIQQSETRAIMETFSHPNSEVLKELKNGSKLDYFWQLSKGNPAELNYHMSRWLDEHSPTQVVEIDTKTQPKAVLKAVVYLSLAIALTTMLIYQDEINRWIAPQTEDKKTVSIEASEGETPLVSKSNKTQVSNEQKSESKKNTEDNSQEKSKGETQSDVMQHFEQALTEAEELTPPTQESNTDSKQEKNRKTKQVDSNTPQPTDNQTQPVVESQQQSDSRVVEETSVLTQDEQALLSKESNFFVLQWAGVSSLKAAQKYRDLHIAKPQMRVYRRSSDARILFIIVSDHFSNRALAEFALNDYLQQGVKEKPWIKSLAQVQKEIKQFEKSSR